MNIFGKRLADLRRERGLTQTDIAGYLSMSRSGIQGYETEGKEPNYAAMRRIADYFDVSANYLLGRSDERKKPPIERRPGPAFYNVWICLQYGNVRAGPTTRTRPNKRRSWRFKAIPWNGSTARLPL